jgi:hypothetical protein
LGPPQYSHCDRAAQVPAGQVRCRRCLLKGCEQFYRPSHPQSRYCSDACRREARRWRRRQSSRTWRASARGKARRRAQCRRYRRRIPLTILPECSLPPLEAKALPAACEGQRPAEIPEDFSVRRCQRPGCYEVFLVASSLSGQRFCSSLCRRALRNVLDREARYRRRRRQGVRPRCQRVRPPPGSPL